MIEMPDGQVKFPCVCGQSDCTAEGCGLVAEAYPAQDVIVISLITLRPTDELTISLSDLRDWLTREAA